MAEALAKKKQIRVGHKASTTKTIQECPWQRNAKPREAVIVAHYSEQEIKAVDVEVIDIMEDEMQSRRDRASGQLLRKKVDPVASLQNTRALHKLFDYVSSHIPSLNSLGVECDSYGGLLCSVLLSKTLPELQLIISHKLFQDS